MKYFLPGLTLFLTLTAPAPAQNVAVGGLVGGEVQKVGFRAFIMKQAISQNLTGWTVNLKDGRVSFMLCGDPQRIATALAQIKTGPERSTVSDMQSWNLTQPYLPNTFTLYDWTSESRDLHKPQDLIFSKRPDNSVLTEHEAKKEYHRILKATGIKDP